MTPHQTIAARVKQLRKGRGWSAQHLADQMAAEGIAWDRSIVANLENGRRASVSVEEFLVLAFVLDVAPVHLLVPVDAEETTPYRVVPERLPAGSWFVRAWFRGRTPIGGVDPKRYFAEVPDIEWEPPASQWTPENIEAASAATTEARKAAGRS
ncbi:helix-turn-helix domain-containing protein [Micromonospora sp. RV43]|uniref:helix-turn-helix domain-containing protein n=1 Tax=Micromonospora sp. RV43 TaxID=1661387 RepID=UPI0013792837|nr:helix-turn-helix domain-containing protein [Micromonospora sp. RV43]